MIRFKLGRIASLCGCVLTVLCPCSRAVAANEFIGLAGGSNQIALSEANAVSNDGQVVAGRIILESQSTAFVWDDSIGAQSLPLTLDGFGVSGNGTTIVGSGLNSQTGTVEPFRWTSTTGVQLLGGPAGGVLGSYTTANDVSYDGSIIVGTTNLDGNLKAFRWTQPTGFHLLNETGSATASAISENGEVIVGRTSELGEAYRWTSGSGLVPLGKLSLNGSDATDVSADGTVVVGYSGLQSFRWSAATGMLAIGPGSAFSPYSIDPVLSYALATTQSGEAIVGASSSPYPYDAPGVGGAAYLWTETYGMESLPLVLEHRFGLGAAIQNWRLTEAWDISPDGKAIVGHGFNPDGQEEGWLVRLDRPISVPEPTSFVLVLSVAVLVALRLSRRQ